MSGNRRNLSHRSAPPSGLDPGDGSRPPDLEPTVGIPSLPGRDVPGPVSDTAIPDSQTDTDQQTLQPPSAGQQPRSRRSKRSGGQVSWTSGLAVSGKDRYQTAEQIGRGGWGVVQRAIDQQLQRQVAIKRILSPGKVHPDVRERFLYEARITSQLQHPGIVPVHELQEGDTNDGGSGTYYVMKLLSGRTLRQHIADVHAERKTASRKLDKHTFRDAILPLLERFIDICETIGYAHEQGVIHRDLKPANVMVGQFGETIVVDWGLAKRLGEPDSPTDNPTLSDDPGSTADRPAISGSDAARTSVGSVIGTPAYMSPEQACGDVHALSPASDIYSLGAILYEILKGEHPHAGCDLQTVLRRVRAGQSSVEQLSQSDIPRPLVAICKKAMAVAPTHRYGSAGEVADDVRRFIAGDAVSADRENWTDKLARWCRRHRTLTISAVASTVVLLLASAVFGYQIRRAHLAEQRAHQQTQSAYEETLRRLTQSREAADSWLTELSGSLEFYPGLQPIRRDLIERAIGHYEELLKWDGQLETVVAEVDRDNADGSDIPSGPTTEPVRTGGLVSSPIATSSSPHHRWLTSRLALERSKVHLRLGDLHRLSDSSDQARHHYASAETLLDSLQQPSPPPELAEDVGLQRANVATAHLLMGDTETVAINDRVGWLKQQLHQAGVRHPLDEPIDSASATESSTPSSRDLTFDLVSGLVRLHLACARLDQPTPLANAVEHARQAAAWARQLERTRGRVSDRRLRQTALEQWAALLDQQGDDKAAEVWEQLVRFLEILLEQSPDRIDHRQSLAYARLQWANSLAKQSTSDPEAAPAARRQCEAAIEDLRTAWQQADIDGFYQSNLATAENNLGRLLLQGEEGQTDEARQHLQSSLRLRRGAMMQRPAVEELRYFCQTVSVLLQIETADRLQTGDDLTEPNDSTEPNETKTDDLASVTTSETLSVELLDDADTAYQLIRDHGGLQDDEIRGWAAVLQERAVRYRAAGEVDAAEADDAAAQQLLRTTPSASIQSDAPGNSPPDSDSASRSDEKGLEDQQSRPKPSAPSKDGGD